MRLVQLRRLADELIDASRPICNIEILIDALQNHTTWLDRLRENNGIRDILIHKEHILQVGARGSKRPEEIDINWQISAHLVQGKPGALHTIDLFPALVECIAGACLFMDRLYRSVIPTDSYQQGDVLFLTGSSNNIVGFWPPILVKRTQFPLTA